ncbi:putative ubiquitin-conjugating enzyme protein 17 [Fulvia fulva]|uniref:Ubiquitin-conjugating enzyme protein 17 n=1 Tax=Passalora fulva TaxID=5499 RepID=A0A9Q8PKU0_PASFU|nr:putative ubiquitin-conjugating enzyme protein 17 [Fulvia fulva]UJO24479.1 putative ubiquitin-conjugating enzyme protein 17 [Fulvia fulva]WPV37097.1 putative ubiquitin-conjugating enzyme protein 17 [Fulvia fulva]
MFMTVRATADSGRSGLTQPAGISCCLRHFTSMDREELRRKRRRLFEPGNFADIEDTSNNSATKMSSDTTDQLPSTAHSKILNHDHNLGILTNMGFDIKKAKKALKTAGGDIQQAIDRLFSKSSPTDASSDDDDPEPESRFPAPRTADNDDEALARQLQAEYDGRPAISGCRGSPKRVDSIHGDEAYARSLQAQYDGTATSGTEQQDHTERPSTRNAISPPDSELTPQPAVVQATVRSIAEAITGVKCHNCKKYVVKSESHVLEFSKYIQDSEGRLIAIPCQNCRNPHNDKRARLYMIWALLCDFDANSKQNKPDKRRSTKTAKRAAGNGVGYSGGYGYARQPASGKKMTQPSDDDDVMTAKMTNALRALLPTFDREDEFELDARQLQALFLCSSLLERAAGLLRNNDLEEVTTQKKLYDALARLLQTLAMHPLTSALVFGERVVRSSGASLLKISLGKASLTGGKEVDTVQPLSQCLQEFAVQCSMMLSHSTDPTESQLYQAFIDLRDFLQANGSSAKKAPTPAKNAWRKEYAVSEVPDEYILKNHILASKPQASSHVLPGRMKRIMQEISRLQTSLPDGIFVRYGSSRPDVMKVIIIGPQDTPYENGLFEFDLLCDNDFPTKPPQMQLRTTGNGSVRFNPNLYNCGKVCLSLLGTWEGEKWDAKQSTLLQVLVSIQAMIFCDFPWFNEPGRGNSDARNAQSVGYNKFLQPKTIQHAMISWLEDRHDIWSAIIEQHFHTNEKDIRATISKWTSETGGPTILLQQCLKDAVSKLSKGIPRGQYI